MKWHRIAAMLYKHALLMRRGTRLLEIFYWPMLDLLVWGYVSVYIMRVQAGGGRGFPDFVALFLGGLIFWEVLFRSQQAITISFLEDVWARNLLNLFVSPLTPGEFIVSTILLGIVKTAVGAVVMGVVAYLLYSFNVLSIGLPLVLFFANLLLLGWAIGIVTTTLIMRYGQSAEVLAWGLAFLVQPFTCVFYPLSALPKILQKVAWWIPATHIFEGMRQVIAGQGFSGAHLAWSFGLSLAYLAVAAVFFRWMFGLVKERGLLMKLEQ